MVHTSDLVAGLEDGALAPNDLFFRIKKRQRDMLECHPTTPEVRDAIVYCEHRLRAVGRRITMPKSLIDLAALATRDTEAQREPSDLKKRQRDTLECHPTTPEVRDAIVYCELRLQEVGRRITMPKSELAALATRDTGAHREPTNDGVEPAIVAIGHAVMEPAVLRDVHEASDVPDHVAPDSVGALLKHPQQRDADARLTVRTVSELVAMKSHQVDSTLEHSHVAMPAPATAMPAPATAMPAPATAMPAPATL